MARHQLDQVCEIDLQLSDLANLANRLTLLFIHRNAGKTLAFAIPVVRFIDRMKHKKQDEKLRALIMAPTRELVVQIKKHIDSITKHTAVTSLPIIGGLTIEKQLRLLKRRPDIVIGTPGRLWEIIEEESSEHLNERTLKAIKFLVIDEFDRMIEKNHFEEMKKIIKIINSSQNRDRRQILVYSATLTYVIKTPDRWKAEKKNVNKKITLGKKIKYMKAMVGIKDNCEVIDLTNQGIGKPDSDRLEEYTITCVEEEKDIYLYYILGTSYGKTLIFCNSKDCCRRLISILKHMRVKSVDLHSELDQKTRLKHLEKFANNQDVVLVASDIAARGLDIENVERVIHYQIPHTTESYVHRSGRTARGVNSGISIMLYDPKESRLYKRLITSLGDKIDCQTFPVDKKVFEVARQRVKLAQELNAVEHRANKKRSANDWFRRAADECEIDLSGRSDIVNEPDNTSKHRDANRMKQLKGRLDALLETPISRIVSLQQFIHSLQSQNLTLQ